MRSAANPEPPEELIITAIPRVRSSVRSSPSSISTSSSTIITGYLKIVKKVITGRSIFRPKSASSCFLVACACVRSV